MLRTILHRRSTQSPINPSPTSDFSAIGSQFPPNFRYFSNSHQNQDETYRDPDAPPRLFVVQPRLRPQTQLKAKLEEALNLANSLEQQRDEFSETELPDKEMPPHVVVQNPAAKSPRAGNFSIPYFSVSLIYEFACWWGFMLFNFWIGFESDCALCWVLLVSAAIHLVIVAKCGCCSWMCSCLENLLEQI